MSVCAQAVAPLATVRAQDHLGGTALMNASNDCPCFIQMLFRVRAAFVRHNQILPLVSEAFALVWSCDSEQL